MKSIEFIKGHSDLSSIYYVDIYGVKHYAPFFSQDDVKSVYADTYITFREFEIVVNLLAANHHEKLRNLSSAEQLVLLSQAIHELNQRQ